MKLYNAITDRLKSQHEAIGEIIAGVDKEHLYKKPAENKWSIHDNLAHLGSYQPIFLERIDIILAEQNPSFGRYKADDDPGFLGWLKFDVNEIIEKIQADRIEIFEKINRLSESELARTGTHAKFGQLDIPGWTEFFLLHEAHHLFTIFQLAKSDQNI